MTEVVFKPGDLVRLKTNEGPNMVVVRNATHGEMSRKAG